MSDKSVFMDYQSTTPADSRVLEAMIPYFTEKFGNCHSKDHRFGWEAEDAVEQAREKIAQTIGASPKEIIFTSGATESNNIALKGVADFHKTERHHIVVSAIEHKCVINTAKYMSSKGFKVSYAPVQKNGIIDLRALKEIVTKETLLVSVMAINNEIGTIQPLREVAAVCKASGAFFHTDAAQAFGKIPIDVTEMGIDLMSISAHKIYGPKGIGALYVRSKPKIRITPLIHGGRQERGIRSGTIPVPLAVGFGVASELAVGDMNQERQRLSRLFEIFYNNTVGKIPCVYLNGDKQQRYPGNINLSFAGVEGESMMGAMPNIAISSGSACTSDSLEPSHVLRAIDIDRDLAHTALRFGMGRFTTEDEVRYVVSTIHNVVSRLREMSPVWEEMQERKLAMQH